MSEPTLASWFPPSGDSASERLHPVSATIALVGSGEYLEASRAVNEPCSVCWLHPTAVHPSAVVCLPTASSLEGERRVEPLGPQRRDVVRRRSAPRPRPSPVIDRAGRRPGPMPPRSNPPTSCTSRAASPTISTRPSWGPAAWAAVDGVLDRGGVLAGCSAGAMIQGERIAGFRSAAHADGVRLLPGAIVLPHFDEYPSMIGTAVKGLLGRGLTVVGVDGGTALVRHADELRAVGRGAVTVWGRWATTCSTTRSCRRERSARPE